MMTLIIGGAGSGKSEFAETILQRSPGPHLYIATMLPFDEESLRRIERHRALRAGKGFEALECYTNLEKAAERLSFNGGILLECLGTLLANEFFRPEGGGTQAVLSGIGALRKKCSELIIVTNEVFSGGTDYEGDTLLWMTELAGINRMLAEDADRVIETVCGCPNILKGQL